MKYIKEAISEHSKVGTGWGAHGLKALEEIVLNKEMVAREGKSIRFEM